MPKLRKSAGRGLLLLALAALAPGPAGSGEAAERAAERAEAFSRSRWIAERAARGVHFSGGVLPADREALLRALDAPDADAAIAVAPPAQAPLNRPVRVSGDLVPADDSGAQPETQAEPHLALDPGRESRLLAGYQEGRFADGGARALTYALSEDSGRRWREGLLPGLTSLTGGSYERASDPWVAYGPGGRAYYATLAFDETTSRNGIFVSSSADGGRTWDSPVAVHLGGAGEFDDKEAMAVDTRADSPFRGRVYVGWDSVDNGGLQTLRMAWSDDGLSFVPPVTIERAATAIGILPLVGPGGVLHAVWVHGQGNDLSLVAARSEDGGATWSAPATVNLLVLTEVAGLRTGSILPAAAIDPTTGHLAVAWQDGRFSSGVAQILLSLSSDGGRTWSPPRRVSDGPDDAPAFTPAVAFDGRGNLGVSYYSLRHDPARRFQVDPYLALSKNRGRRFLKSRRMSTASWDVRFAALASGGFFLGDYQGLAAGRQLFHSLWIATAERSRIAAPARQPDAFTRAVLP